MSRMDQQSARQGRKGIPVLKVLIAALVLCVIGAIGLSFYGRSMPDQTLTNATTTVSPASQNNSTSSGTEPATSTTTAK